MPNVFSRTPPIKGIFMQRAKVIRSLGMHIARSSHGPSLSFSLAARSNRLKRAPKGSARVIALFLSSSSAPSPPFRYRRCHCRHRDRHRRRHRRDRRPCRRSRRRVMQSGSVQRNRALAPTSRYSPSRSHRYRRWSIFRIHPRSPSYRRTRGDRLASAFARRPGERREH